MKHYNALAHMLPEIGKVTRLTLQNVRDLDVEGHAWSVFDSAVEFPVPKNLRNKTNCNALAVLESSTYTSGYV